MANLITWQRIVKLIRLDFLPYNVYSFHMDRGREFSRLVAIELAAEGKRRGITQQDVAAAAGIGAPQFSIYIAGSRGSMTLATLVRAAEYLGIDPDVIVQRAYAALEDETD